MKQLLEAVSWWILSLLLAPQWQGLNRTELSFHHYIGFFSIFVPAGLSVCNHSVKNGRDNCCGKLERFCLHLSSPDLEKDYWQLCYKYLFLVILYFLDIKKSQKIFSQTQTIVKNLKMYRNDNCKGNGRKGLQEKRSKHAFSGNLRNSCFSSSLKCWKCLRYYSTKK